MILQTINLTHTYSAKTPFEKTAIKNVNIEVEKGAFVGIIGHTGSGKSTLMQHFNGLLKPTAGRVLFNGADIWAKPKEIKAIRNKIGMVFQYPENQLFEETVYKDIAYGPKNMGLSKVEINERVIKTAKFIGISEDMLEKSPFELSGGEKRKVAIAGVIAMEPEILILDEPTAGLDPHGRDEVLNYIKNYRESYKKTVILVTHSMDDIVKYAEKIYVMSNAGFLTSGTIAEVFSNAEKLIDNGLDIPEITKLFIRLNEIGIDVNKNIFTIEDAINELCLKI